MIKKVLLTFSSISLFIAFTILLWLKINVSGGEVFTETFPNHPNYQRLIIAGEFDDPPGNIAVRGDEVIAISFHPEAYPKEKVIIIRNGVQEALPKIWFQTVLSVRFDREGNLWALDHAFHGLGNPRLLKIDIDKRRIIQEIEIKSEVADLGSNLNDFQIDESRNLIFIADTSFLRNQPGLIIVDIKSGKSKRKLDRHKSVARGRYAVTVNDKLIGLPPIISMRPGVDSIVLDRQNQWLYFCAMSSENLYRIKVEDLINDDLSKDELNKKIENYAFKPPSDGLTIDIKGNIYVTSVQDSSIGIINPIDQKYEVYAFNKEMDWPDGMSFGSSNNVYVTASSLHNVVFKFPGSWKALKPFKIFKFKALHVGVPGS